MPRRILAALLALWFAIPAASFAAPSCPMKCPMVASAHCRCCKTGKANAACGQQDCRCAISQGSTAQPTAAATPTTGPEPAKGLVTRLAAAVSTPRRAPSPVPIDPSPPGGVLAARSLLCSWVV